MTLTLILSDEGECVRVDEREVYMQQKTFYDLGLSKLVLQGIEMMGYVMPSPIQEKAIPVLLEGKDIIGQAQTGTGKTLAFGSVLLSCIEKSQQGVQALILSPTRELALQIDEELRRIGKYTRLSIVSVYGGSEIEKQIRALKSGHRCGNTGSCAGFDAS